MSTQIKTPDINQRLDIDSHDSEGLMQGIRREEFASRALRLWSPWQTPLGIDHVYAGQIEDDMTEIYEDKINLREDYQWLTCYVWLPEEYNVADIDPETILLNGRIRASCFEIKGEMQLLIARFSWSQVEEIIKPGEFEFTVSAELYNGASFDSSDTVTVINEVKQE